MNNTHLPGTDASWKSLLKINVAFLQTGLFTSFAVWCWPETAQGYFGWYFLAIVSGLIAVASLLVALNAIVKHKQRENTLRGMTQNKQQAASASLASEETLDKEGML